MSAGAILGCIGCASSVTVAGTVDRTDAGSVLGRVDAPSSDARSGKTDVLSAEDVEYCCVEKGPLVALLSLAVASLGDLFLQREKSQNNRRKSSYRTAILR